MPWFIRINRKQLLAALAVLAGAGLLLYLHTLHAPWYLDDSEVIVNNRHLADLLRGDGVLATRGLALWTFAVQLALTGYAFPPLHLVNILLHIACGWTVFLLLLRVFPRDFRLPLGGALLFVVHPLQTSAVTYLVQRMTVMATLFIFLALLCGSRAWELRAAGEPFRTPRHLAWYGGALLCAFLAMPSKEIAVTLPLLFWLYARFFLPPLGGGWRALGPYLAPFAVAPLIYAGMALGPLLAKGGGMSTVAGTQLLAGMEGNDPLHYLVTQFSVLWIYLRLLVVPIGQALDYGYPISRELVTLKSTAGLLGLLGLVALAWRLRQVRPAISCGIFWFFVALAPESSLIPLDALFEHRLYLPMFGFVLCACGLLEMVPRPAWQVTLAVLLFGVLGLLTWQRNALWTNQIAFFEDNLRQRPDNERVCFNLAGLYLRAGRAAEREALLLRALQRRPGYVKAADGLSRIRFAAGRKEEGLQILEDAVRADPKSGLLLIYLSVYKEDLGDMRGSEEAVWRALAVEPELFIANLRLGRLLARRGDLAGAERYVRKAIAIDSTHAQPFTDLGNLMQVQRRYAEAREAFAAAEQLKQKYPDKVR